MRLIIGGKDGDLPGFNGQFVNVHLGFGRKWFANTEGQAESFTVRPISFPKAPWDQSEVQTDNEFEEMDEVEGEPEMKEVVEYPFANEYSISGWFRWVAPKKMQRYHAVFRMTTESDNKDVRRLGDRDLAAFIGSQGEYVFATYYYDDLLGNGNANSAQTIKHQDVHYVWHFLYFGYTHIEKRAHAYASFRN